MLMEIKELELSLARLKRALNYEGSPDIIIDRAAKEIYVLRDERDSLVSTLKIYKAEYEKMLEAGTPLKPLAVHSDFNPDEAIISTL